MTGCHGRLEFKIQTEIKVKGGGVVDLDGHDIAAGIEGELTERDGLRNPDLTVIRAGHSHARCGEAHDALRHRSSEKFLTV